MYRILLPLFLCAFLYAQPTLTDIDRAQKKAATIVEDEQRQRDLDADIVQRQLLANRAESKVFQERMLDNQAAAARLAAGEHDSNDLLQYKHELRLESIEKTIGDAAQAKTSAEAAAQAEAKKYHDDLMLTIREIGIGLAVPLLLGLFRILRNMRVIHGLVNSNMTSSMQAELNAQVAYAVALRELIASRDAAGAHEAQARLLSIERRITELTSLLAERRIIEAKLTS